MTAPQQLLVVNEFHPETVAKLDSLYDTHHLWQTPVEERPALLKRLQGQCREVATASWTCDDFIYEIKSLELISAFGVGVDGIDFNKTRSQHISVTNTPDVLNDAVADLAIALILATTRNLINADRFVRTGGWLQGPLPFGHGLSGKTLGIAGLGRIGEAIVKRALPFKLKIAYHNRSPKNLPYTYYSSLTDLAAHCDIFLCMLPGGEDTRHAIDAEVLQNLKNGSVFINVGRGSCVDETALIDALNTGRLGAAGLDVYEDEPKVRQDLLGIDNVVLLPHIGSATIETRQEMGNLVIRNLEAFFAGTPLLTEVT